MEIWSKEAPNHQPSVSIVMPFFNAGRFIREAIESVLAQTYTEWELLLVDDGSNDKSTFIARKYTEQYPHKLRYFEHAEHQNRGKSASRNLALQNAAGQYIGFLDADDVWLPDILKDQIALLESHPEAGMVYGPLQWWYGWTGDPEDIQKDTVENLGVPPDTVISPPLILTGFLQDRAAVPSNILVRKEIIEQAGNFEEDFRTMYEDQVFVAKICLQAPVYASSKCWYRYRQHPEQSCAIAQITGEYFEARPKFLYWLENYLAERQYEDPELWCALNEELWPHTNPGLAGLQKIRKELVRIAKRTAIQIATHTLPVPIRRWLWSRWVGQDYIPPVGWTFLGNLRRVNPFSRESGYDRGLPIDRYYIEKFLSDHQTDIKGHVLEIADDSYTRQFGKDRVTLSDVLHAVPGNPKATIVGDIVCADHIPSNSFDCIILTQTLQLIYDVSASLRTLFRILTPGGVLIATMPGLSPISRYDAERWGYYWGFTSQSVQRLFEEAFPAANVYIQAYGNVLTATAFLYGMATQELKREEMDFLDEDYEVLIAVRAEKPIEKTLE